MMKPKIYIETTLFNYYFLKDITRQADIDATRKLFKKIKQGEFTGYVSAVTIGELEDCPKSLLREKMLKLISEYKLVVIKKNSSKGFEKLAQEYIKAGAIPAKKIPDAFHIATATLSKMDILSSWNCSHIVRYKTQQIVYGVNLTKGLKYISINTPMEVVSDEKNFK